MLALCYANLLCLFTFILLSAYINVKRGDNISDTLVIYTTICVLGIIATSGIIAIMYVGI